MINFFNPVLVASSSEPTSAATLESVSQYSSGQVDGHISLVNSSVSLEIINWANDLIQAHREAHP
jgi:hypothetical protein